MVGHGRQGIRSALMHLPPETEATMSIRIRRSMAAAIVTCTFALTGLGQMDPAQAEETTTLAGHQMPGNDDGGDHRLGRGAGPFDGAILAVGLLGNLVGRATTKAPDNHCLKGCTAIGNCKASISGDSSATPPKLEIRKQVLQPVRSVPHKPTGRPYDFAQD